MHSLRRPTKSSKQFSIGNNNRSGSGTQQNTATRATSAITNSYLYSSFEEFARSSGSYNVVPPPAMLRISSSAASSVSSISTGTMITMATQSHTQSQAQNSKQSSSAPSSRRSLYSSRKSSITSSWKDYSYGTTSSLTITDQSSNNLSNGNNNARNKHTTSTTSSPPPPPPSSRNRVMMMREAFANTAPNNAAGLEYQSSDESAFERLAFRSLSYRKSCIQMEATKRTGSFDSSQLRDSLSHMDIDDHDSNEIDVDTLHDACTWLSVDYHRSSNDNHNHNHNNNHNNSSSSSLSFSVEHNQSTSDLGASKPRRPGSFRSSTSSSNDPQGEGQGQGPPTTRAASKSVGRGHSVLAQCRKNKRDLLQGKDPTPEETRRLQHPSLANHDYSQRLRPSPGTHASSQRGMPVDHHSTQHHQQDNQSPSRPSLSDNHRTNMGAKSYSLSMKRHEQDFPKIMTLSNARRESLLKNNSCEQDKVYTASRPRQPHEPKGRKSLSLSSDSHEKDFKRILSLVKHRNASKQSSNDHTRASQSSTTRPSAHSTGTRVPPSKSFSSGSSGLGTMMSGSSHRGTSSDSCFFNDLSSITADSSRRRRYDNNTMSPPGSPIAAAMNLSSHHRDERRFSLLREEDVPRNSDLDNFLLQDANAVERQQAILDSIGEEQRSRHSNTDSRFSRMGPQQQMPQSYRDLNRYNNTTNNNSNNSQHYHNDNSFHAPPSRDFPNQIMQPSTPEASVGTVLASPFQSRAKRPSQPSIVADRFVTLANGEKVWVKGRHHGFRAILQGQTTRLIRCLHCQAILQIEDSAELVYCPDCCEITPKTATLPATVQDVANTIEGTLEQAHSFLEHCHKQQRAQIEDAVQMARMNYNHRL